MIGRVLAQELTGALGQTVVVENRAGAAGNIGADQVAKAPADGTLLMGALTSHSINAALYRGRVTYDVEKSFAPVSIVGTVPLVFVVNPSVQATSLSQLIALAKSKPGYITMGSAGNGSPQHLAGEMFKRRRRGHPARAVQGQRPGHDRPDGRPGAEHDRNRARRPGQHQGRQAARWR